MGLTRCLASRRGINNPVPAGNLFAEKLLWFKLLMQPGETGSQLFSRKLVPHELALLHTLYRATPKQCFLAQIVQNAERTKMDDIPAVFCSYSANLATFATRRTLFLIDRLYFDSSQSESPCTDHSTVTLFAKFLGLSTSVPRATAV